MIKISQTDYIDFLATLGLSRFSKVRSIFNRPDYHPNFDYYKSIRDRFIEYLKFRGQKNDLYTFLTGQEGKKQSRFECLIKGYLKFLGRKKVNWIEPPVAYWKYKTLSIKMNPEIAMSINDQHFIVKMYFKETPLTSSSVKVLLSMMDMTLSNGIFTGYKCALLDVERGKLHYNKTKAKDVTALLEGEAESFIKMWESLESKSA